MSADESVLSNSDRILEHLFSVWSGWGFCDIYCLWIRTFNNFAKLPPGCVLSNEFNLTGRILSYIELNILQMIVLSF